jgi:mRNA interferase MazF
VKRGEIWWVNLDTKGGDLKRPALILTVDALNRARRTLVVVPLSSATQPRPPIVVATPSAGAISVAICDQVRSVDRGRFVERIGALSEIDLQAVALGVKTVLGLP